MDTADWIARHALALWALVLLLAVMTGDSLWLRAQRLRPATATALQRHRHRRMAAVLIGVLAAGFVLLARAIDLATPGHVLAFDTALTARLHAYLPLPALRVIAVLTQLGDLAWVALASIVVLVVLLWRRQGQLAAWWTLAVGGIVPLNSALKVLFRRARPLYDHGLINEPGFSFPSGHAFGAIVFYGMLAYVLLRLLPARLHRAVIAVCIAMAVLIGVSRILLQVHYASDVLGGFASGAVWLTACIALAEHWRSRASDTRQ